MNEDLARVYYDPKRPGGLGGMDRLYQEVKKKKEFDIRRKTIRE